MNRTIKKYLSVALCAPLAAFWLAQTFAASISGTNVAAPVVPFDTADTYPSHMAIYGKGGYVQAQSTSVSNVPLPRRTEGMVVYSLNAGKEYRLVSGGWQEVQAGGVDLAHFADYSAARQAEIAGKASTGHLHTGTYEPANSNIQGHIASTANPHSTTAGQVGAESYLGTPTVDGDCLKSTAGGTRSWGTCGGGGSVTPDGVLDAIGTPLDRAMLKQPAATTSAVAQLVVRDCSGVPTYEVYSDGAVIIWSSPRLDDRMGTNATAPFANQSTVSRSTSVYAKFRGPVFTLTTSNFRIYSGAGRGVTVARSIWASPSSARVTPVTNFSARKTITAIVQNITNACNSVLTQASWTFKTGN